MFAEVGVVGQRENGYLMMAHRIDEERKRLAQEMYSMSTGRGKRRTELKIRSRATSYKAFLLIVVAEQGYRIGYSPNPNTARRW